MASALRILFILAALLPINGRADTCREKFAELLGNPQKFKTDIFDVARKTPIYLLKQGGKAIIYPTIAPLRVIWAWDKAVKQKKSFLWASVLLTRKDGVAIAAVAGTYAYYHGPPAQVATYLLLPGNLASNYEKQLDDRERLDGITIYVSGIPKDNVLAGFGESDFQRRFGAQKNTYFLQAIGLREMFEQIHLIKATSGLPIVRLEILGHGMPGSMDIWGEDLNSESAKRFASVRADFAPGAEIRFQSCLLGANLFGLTAGSSFMNAVGKNALGKGGSVFASNHVVWVDLPFEKKYHKPWTERFFEDFLAPLETGIMAGIEAGKVLSGTIQPYRRLEFPAPISPEP